MGKDGSPAVSAEDWADDLISPEDRLEIELTAEQIVKNEGMWLEVQLMTPVEGAREFIDTFDRAANGDIMAMFGMMTFISQIAETLQQGLDEGEG